MKVIALRGDKDAGKSSTLRIVRSVLLQKGYIQVVGAYQEMGGDLLDVLEDPETRTRIGIVTQGDYQIGKNSVKNHLWKLESYGCQIAICAGTREPEGGRYLITKAIERYPHV